MTFLSAVESAFTPAATPAAQAASDPVDLVNNPSGYPVQEKYPGAVTPAQYGPGSGPQPGGDRGGPVSPAYGPEPFTSSLPVIAPGGGFQDTGWMTGHDAPQAVWDSSAGAPFAPSGALDPDLHSVDTGGVYAREYVAPAAIGSLTRRTQPGQTTIRNGTGDQVTKDNVTSPNGRTNLDQYQYWDADAFDPWTIPYGERPVYNNLAWEGVALDPVGGTYTPAGALSDRSVYDYSAQAYEQPPDPTIGSPATQTGADSGIGGGWV